jgi:hypothetical protein
MTKSAKISCKAFSYGAIPDPLGDLRSPKMEQMKGIDALQKLMSGRILLFLLVGDI